MSTNVAIQCTIKRQRPPGGVARVRCAEKKGAYVYHALSAQPGMLIDLTLSTIEHFHEYLKKHVGVEHGPHQCRSADRATARQGCQSMQTAVANKLSVIL